MRGMPHRWYDDLETGRDNACVALPKEIVL